MGRESDGGAIRQCERGLIVDTPGMNKKHYIVVEVFCAEYLMIEMRPIRLGRDFVVSRWHS